MKLDVVILAAGCGTRMHSNTPKVLHQLAGKPLLAHVIETAHSLDPNQVHVVYGHQGERVKHTLSSMEVNWIEQKEQLGTGHAVLQALPFIDKDSQVLVLYGDVPLITKPLLLKLLDSTSLEGVGIISVMVTDPTGLGRIIRDNSGNLSAIVEHKDATDAELLIHEINSGILTASAKSLHDWLPKLKNNNSQSEFYLTDLITLAASEKHSVIAVLSETEEEVKGVNNRVQLMQLERFHQRKLAHALLTQGVCVYDPDRFDCRGNLQAGRDTEIDINVLIEGEVVLGSNCYIGPNVILRNTTIADNVTIRANSILEDSQVDEGAVIGPFARLRPETKVAKNGKIGNFVEIKKAHIGENSKVNHLSYVGDATVGTNVNIGAGTITCNYDGVNKHQTIIEDGAFIGSGTQLVAPVKVAMQATIGAGSVITTDAPAEQLTLTRAKQRTISAWQRPTKQSEK